MPEALAPATEAPPNYAEIASRLRDGMIVPFFGAGASRQCGLPSASELAAELVKKSGYPDKDGQDDLALMASYFVSIKDGDAVALHALLRKALAVPAEPGQVHLFLSNPIFKELRLFVTTNYDDLVERALAPRRPWIVVDRGHAGKVWCRSPDGEWDETESKSLGYTIKDSTNPIVLKLHGSLHQNRGEDSFLITEEHYVDFLGRSEGGQLPQMLAADMRQRSFLFLGYGLKDWNIRVMLRKLAETRGRGNKILSWAVVLNPSAAERTLWEAQGVRLHSVDLNEFVEKLRDAL